MNHRFSRSMPPTRSGMAMIVTISMIAAVAVALVLIARLTILDAKRSQAEFVDAQLRTMLLAGEDWTLTNAASLRAGSQSIPLPASLAGGTLTIHVDPSSLEDRRRIEMQAAWLDRVQSQSLIYGKDDVGWKLLNIDLSEAQSIDALSTTAPTTAP